MNTTVEKNTKIKSCRDDARSTCALANGLDLVGDRWTLLIIRDLMFTNRNEFGHFVNSGEGISTNILTDRLERLQQCKIITKLPHPTHGKKNIYQLTDQGLALFPVLIELILWSYRTIKDTFVPEPVYQMMINDRETLYEKIKSREPLFLLEL